MDEKPDVVTDMGDPGLDQLRADMNQTKSDMEGTIHKMRERFSMDRVKKKTQDMAEGWWQRASALIQERGEVIQGAAGRVGHAIKENPVPFAIVGAAGAGVLAYSLFQRQSGYPDESTEEEQSATGESLKERAGYAARWTGDRARSLSGQARFKSKQMGEDFLDTVREHPFIIGGAVFCMGLLGGLLIPPTRQEDELMGSASDAIKEKAKEKKEEVLESAKRVAEQTKQAAQEEAEKLGFS